MLAPLDARVKSACSTRTINCCHRSAKLPSQMKAANYAPASHHSALRPPSLGDNGLGHGASQELRRPSLGDNGLGLGASQEASLFRVLCESRLIARRTELIGWLQGEVRRVLPHQILIAAWGDFARWNVKCDLVSSIPGVRSLPLGRCPAEEFIRNSYRRWVRGGREPLRLDAAEASPAQVPCHCPLHIAIGQMRSLVVHGVSDKLSGCDSLYLFLDSRSRAELDAERGFVALAHLLVCQIDVAL